jgi:putative membrane protein
MIEQTRGWSGFLPGRASLMLDLIVVTMVAVLIALGASLWLVRYRRKYSHHRAIQITLASALVVILVLFEIDIRFIDNWMDRANASPYFDAMTRTGLVTNALAIHLVFATSTFALWLMVIVRALRNCPSPPEPSAHSRFHRRWGTIAAVDMLLTTITGWAFYWLAFVA